MLIKNIKYIVLSSLLVFGCSDVLDKRNLSAITGDAVWNDESLTEGFLNRIYGSNLSNWDNQTSAWTNDANGAGATSSIVYGELPDNSINIYTSSYSRMNDINVFLRDVKSGGIDPAVQDLMYAQALFFRAKVYFELTRHYGGVPIILEPAEQGVELDLSRKSAQKCFDQIIKDLDDAITGLPNSYDDASSDYGRITKGAAMAYKGRVLLYWASEQFDPGQSASGRWQAAYDASKAAVTQLTNNEGKGLHDSFSDLWFDESNSNPEAVLVTRYDGVIKANLFEAGSRPFVVGTNGENYHNPTINFANAFPMKDGLAIDDASSAYTYNSTTFWKNRDPRFEATIAWNGTIWPLNNSEPNRTSDLEWAFQNSATEAQADSRISPTGMRNRKAVEGTLQGGGQSMQGQVDYIDIRFTEVLFNIAEAANEIGNGTEALDILKEIRNRAGIDEGSGRHGLAAGLETDKDAMRDAIFLEKRIEMAFEGKRFWDLRRRRMLETLNGIHRKGYYIESTSAFDNLEPSTEVILDDRKVLEAEVLAGNIDLDDPAVYNTYFSTSIRSLERFGGLTADGDAINFLSKYYFFDVPQTSIDKNPQLVQTKDWAGGSFDPLQ